MKIYIIVILLTTFVIFATLFAISLVYSKTKSCGKLNVVISDDNKVEGIFLQLESMETIEKRINDGTIKLKINKVKSKNIVSR